MRGATFYDVYKFRSGRNFNPRAPCGARPLKTESLQKPEHFNPRAPCGARLTRTSCGVTLNDHFNPRAPCGARLTHRDWQVYYLWISIHAPHAGRDGIAGQALLSIAISIHAPHAGRDRRESGFFRSAILFQSTRPMRGATACP